MQMLCCTLSIVCGTFDRHRILETGPISIIRCVGGGGCQSLNVIMSSDYDWLFLMGSSE
jgi:hypothetical protein